MFYARYGGWIKPAATDPSDGIIYTVDCKAG